MLVIKSKTIRTSAKGIIARDNHILLIKNSTTTDTWYTFPGGGPDQNQNSVEWLRYKKLKNVLDLYYQKGVAPIDPIYPSEFCLVQDQFKIEHKLYGFDVLHPSH